MHKSSFKLEYKRTSTTLSQHLWKLKNKNINFNIKWGVVKKKKKKKRSHSHHVIKCADFAYKKKQSILRSAPSVNKRSEVFGHCIRKKKNLA